MKYQSSKLKLLLLIFILAFVNAGCDKVEQTTITPSLTPLSASDECHVCGMRITHFPGPKGQAFIKRAQYKKRH